MMYMKNAPMTLYSIQSSNHNTSLSVTVVTTSEKRAPTKFHWVFSNSRYMPILVLTESAQPFVVPAPVGDILFCRNMDSPTFHYHQELKWYCTRFILLSVKFFALCTWKA